MTDTCSQLSTTWCINIIEYYYLASIADTTEHITSSAATTAMKNPSTITITVLSKIFDK
jgi:hypothetical protein